MTTGFTRAVALLAFLLAAPQLAQAQAACRADAKRLCAGVKPGGGRLQQCLTDNMAAVSQACQGALERGARRTQAREDDCGADVARFCGEARTPREISACLSANQAQLSERCQKRVEITDDLVAGAKEACASDMSRYCSGVKQGGGRAMQCLKQHESTLSTPCAMQLGVGKVGQQCKEDAQRLCGDVQPGQGRLLACMKRNESGLSPECRSEITTQRAGRRSVADACKEDAARLCKDIRPGGRRFLRCLRDNRSELSQACQDVI